MGVDWLEDRLAANAAYAERYGDRGSSALAAKGMAVLTCMDARIDPLAMLGLERGDAIVLRNGGARVTDDVVRSLVIAESLLGVKRLMVIGHTRCGLTAESDEALRASMRVAGRPAPTDIAFLAAPDPAEAVCQGVEKLRSSVDLGRLEIAGFLYDVDSGTLRKVC